MKIEYQNRIEDYLVNRMSDEERLEFEQELEKNAELREQYEFISTLKTALIIENIENNVSQWNKAYKEEISKQGDGEVAATMREYKATGSGYESSVDYDHRTYAPPRSSNRKFIYWISGIAALFIVGFFLFKNVYFVEDADVAFSPRPQGVSTIRGIDSTTENLLAKADYQGAFDRIIALEDEIDTKLMMIDREINSRGETEDEKLAYKQKELKVRQEELSWLKVQALLGLHRKEEAIALLEKIRNSESEYKEQADSLYNMLKE